MVDTADVTTEELYAPETTAQITNDDLTLLEQLTSKGGSEWFPDPKYGKVSVSSSTMIDCIQKGKRSWIIKPFGYIKSEKDGKQKDLGSVNALREKKTFFDEGNFPIFDDFGYIKHLKNLGYRPVLKLRPVEENGSDQIILAFIDKEGNQREQKFALEFSKSDPAQKTRQKQLEVKFPSTTLYLHSSFQDALQTPISEENGEIILKLKTEAEVGTKQEPEQEKLPERQIPARRRIAA